MPGTDFGSMPSLKQLAYDSLKQRIIDGELKPGFRLREEDLSAEMNISRAPIREALNMLERDGFTTIVPRKGAIVAEVVKEDLYYIWEMRALLEPYAARLSAELVPPEKIAEVKGKLLTVLEHPGDLSRYMESDLELHQMLGDYLENRFLKNTLENMKAHSLRIRWAVEYDNEDAQASVVEAATREHMDIACALEKRNPELVYRVVKQHVENSARRLTGAGRVNQKK